MARLLSSSSSSYDPLTYSVPSLSGGFLPADPIKFCLKYRPPTLAIVYQFVSKPRKYVHEFKIEMHEKADLNKICEELFAREQSYFNPQKIEKKQVMDLLTKLYNHLYPKREEQPPKERKQNYFERKRFIDYAEEGGNKDQDKQRNKAEDDEEDNDPWDFDRMKKKEAKP